MEPVDTARQFWTARDEQPNLGQGAKRLVFESLRWIVPRLEGDTLLDIGSGTGGFARCLRETTKVHVTRCDLNPAFVADDPDAFVYDINSGDPLPKTDMASLIGVLIYSFTDDALDTLLKATPARTIFVRCPVTTTRTDVTINKKIASGENYAGCYRTHGNLLRLIGARYRILEVSNVFPYTQDNGLETTQLFIMGRKR